MSGIEGVGLALEGTELCLSIGKAIAKLRKAVVTAEKETAERLLQVDSYWVRLESQIEFLQTKRILNVLSYERRVNFERLLAQLAVVFQQAERTFKALQVEQESSSLVPQVTSPLTASTKFKYATRHKKQLDNTVDELRKWYGLFDASWFELALQHGHSPGSGAVDVPEGSPMDLLASLRKAMERNEAAIANRLSEPYHFHDKSYLARDQRPIASSSAVIAKEARPGGQPVIIDPILAFKDCDITEIEKDIANLARTLSAVDPLSFGLLSCLGVIRPEDALAYDPECPPNEGRYEYQFVFAWPENCRNPISLRNCLSGSMDSYPLHRRFEIAKCLARSVLFVHNAGLVHKGIRPENVVLFREGKDGYTTSFLLGFEHFRPTTRTTLRRGDILWERDLYRHPDRQGLHPSETYRMEHDIYSLGVCLLEIGLWTSFTITKEEESVVPDTLISLARVQKIVSRQGRAVHGKRTLLAMADQYLPGKMGEIYTEVVKLCLTCLDGSESQPEVSGEDTASRVRLEFIEDILTRLMEIRV